MRRHLSYANVMGTLALFVALGGSSYAALNLPKNSVTTVQVKNGSLLAKDFKKGQLKRGTAGPQGLQGLAGPIGPVGPSGPAGKAGADGAPGAPGLDGTAKAYAYVGGPGTVGQAKVITQANVHRTQANSIGVYCIKGLPFEPKNGQVTPDGLSGSENVSATIDVPSNGGPCGFEQATIEIRYMTVNFTTKTFSYSHIDHGFYVELN